MTQIHEQPPKPELGDFLSDIQGYFNEHLYPGFKKPFEIDQVLPDEVVMQVRPTANARIVTVKGLDEEDLYEADKEWASGLREVGQKYGVELRLPSYYIGK